MSRADFLTSSVSKGGMWEEVFSGFRSLVCFTQICLSGCIAVYNFFNTMMGPSGNENCSRKILEYLVVAGTIGHITMKLGYMWMKHPDRVLPFWAFHTRFFSFRPIAKFLFHHHHLHNALVAFMYLTLWGCLFSSERFLLPFLLLFLFLGLCDLWRLINYHQWFFCMGAFLFDDPVTTLRLWLSGLYFWSGFQKLVMPTFYKTLGTVVFEPIHQFLGFFLKSWDAHHQEKIFAAVTGFGVALETLMGISYFFYPSVPISVTYLVNIFNLFLHSYIVSFIGYKHQIFAFWCWNLMCVSVAGYVFSPLFCQSHLTQVSIISSGMSYFNIFTFLILWVYPATVLFGKSLDPILSHAYFSPGWYPRSILLLPKSTCAMMPTQVNHIDFSPISQEHSSRDFHGIMFWLGKQLAANPSLEPKLRAHFNLPPDGLVLDHLAQEVIGMDGGWVDMTFNLDPQDPWKTFYNAGPKSFWESFIDFRFKTNALLIYQNGFTITEGKTESLHFLEHPS